MRVLLLCPQFPKSFWSYEKVLELAGRKTLLPPLGLITVAAILPQEWEFKLVDLNIRTVDETEWRWADVVILSAMIVQKEDLFRQIREAKGRHKLVAVGGPYPTSCPEDVKAVGADFLILDEGEITLPMFVAAIERGDTQGTFRANGEKPDVTGTPIPRFDLLELDAYESMSVQFSRGCPFQCEFCDIIVLYGRKPRTKTPAQLIAELNYLYELGWRRRIFVVDDNFIGNKRNVKLLLKELKVWMAKHHYPFPLLTEASVDLAQDPELMQLMVDCNFDSVFLGIETPDEESLSLTQKYQNTRNPLTEAVNAIAESGLMVMAGFIIGFDGEKAGAGDRIVKFVEQTSIPVAFFSMLQALPGTALWNRLEKEKRLLNQNGDINQTTLMNFIPTRPIEEIAQEYVSGFWELYDPSRFLDRTFRHFMKMRDRNYKVPARKLTKRELRALLIICWRQGVVRSTRWQFWRNLITLIWHKPQVVQQYLAICSRGEHFREYRQLVREQIQAQVAQAFKGEQKVLVASR